MVDIFDSTRLIVSEVVNIGYSIPSEFMTLKGPKMIEEGKAMVSFSQKDSLNSFFLTLAMAERNFLKIPSDFNVLLKLGNEKVVTLLNVPDQGTFDKETNMRIYLHTCVIPVDVFYQLHFETVQVIRIEYNGYNHDIKLTLQQQELLKEAMACVGKTAGFYPVKP